MKIVVSGYYGFGNAGDEVLLEALLADLRRLRPEARFVVLSGDPPVTAARHDVEAISRTDPVAFVKALRGARLFISGGGSLLQDVTSPRTVPYYTGLMSLARLMGVPVFVYAQGLGPIRRKGLRRRTGRALRAAAGVTVRDRASAEEARSLSGTSTDVCVTADPVFSLAAATGSTKVASDAVGVGNAALSETGRRLLSALPPGQLIGVSLRPLHGERTSLGGQPSDQLVTAVAGELTSLLPRLDARVLPLPLFPDQDTLMLQRLTELLGAAAVPWPTDIAPQQLRGGDWLALMGHLGLCVTMRLHGLIFAAAAGVPFVAVADDPKVDAHVAELGVDPDVGILPATALIGGERTRGPEDVASKTLASLLERAWGEREFIGLHLRAVLPGLAERARTTAVRAIAVAEGGRREKEAKPKRTWVLGTPVDGVTMEQTVAAAKRFIIDGGPAHIVTANPELVMLARQDETVRSVLADADLVVADGIGVVGAASLLGTPVPERVPGVDLMQALLAEGGKHNWKVYLLGGVPGVAHRAAEQIRRSWPGVRVVGVRDGYFDKDEEGAVVRDIVEAAPDIVFVGMGAPRQELFIAKQRAASFGDDGSEGRGWNVPLAIGVGGSIDVLAGRVPRAPVVWQKLGLEWLYRLLRQPSRVGRALVLPRFALLVLLHAARRNLL